MPVVYRSLRAGDGCAFEVGVAFDVDLKSTIPSFDAALLIHACIVAVAVLFALAEAGTTTCAHDGNAQRNACGFLAGFAHGNVLQALHVQVASHISSDLGCFDVAAHYIGVCTAGDVHRVACTHMAVVICRAVAVGLAFATAGGYV